MKRTGITPKEAALQREHYRSAHHRLTASDGEILFIRRWNPERSETQKKEKAVLIFHGLTAHSGAYDMAGKALSTGGYTAFGLDYRGHGLSGGNRADSPSRARWIADLSETVRYIQGIGFPELILVGHSFGVAAALYTVRAIPDAVSGLILLSGAYEFRPGVTYLPSFVQKIKIAVSSFLSPSLQTVEYRRENMTGVNDPLFNFRYTLRFMRMLNMKELVMPGDLDIPVLVGVGDRDELFEIEKVKELYKDIPGNRKEFLVLEGAYHAQFPVESWEKLVAWLNKSF